ncbi:heterokaryon incompatibility protein-domain-containing protein [Bisporella sp. PMI_857]|nr:heterokaryon incompatibility protein-domain-containing protein [Bisporella sp. PMI_857]
MADLCDACRQIFIQKKASSSPFAHYGNVHDLVKASEHGCSLCSLVWSRLEPHEQDLLTVAQANSSVLEPPRITYHLSSSHRESGWDFDEHNGVKCTFDFGMPETGPIRKEILFLCLQGDIEQTTYHFNSLSKYSKQQDTCDSNSISIVDVISAAISRNPHSTVIDPKAFRQNTNTGSKESLERAARWVNRCIEAHSGCKHQSILTERRLPTRLVWVSPSENGPLRLCETSQLPPDTNYMTLSHCWGKKEFLTLTSENIDKFRAGIQFTDLAKTFQDAVTITRFMRIEYIWIDSLCIIQDSLKDWEKESLLMRDVYSNSFCNIAAAHARNGDGGCFVDRTLPAPPIRVTIPLSFGWDNHFNPGIYESRDSNLWADEIKQSVLQKRGWVFQECILAPRILYFASTQIFFSCKIRLCELYPETLGFFQQPNKRETAEDISQIGFWAQIRSAFADQLLSRRQLRAMLLWSSMVQIYTKRDLTRESDRLVAISGLAHSFQPVFGCRYLAGLWEDHLILQLLWMSRGESTRTESYQAPSWSWASRTGQVTMYTNMAMEIAIGMQLPSNHHTEFDEELAFVVDVETATANNDPMSPVTSGYLRMKGILIPVVLEDGEKEFKIRDHTCSVSADISGEKLVGRFCFVVCVYSDLWFDYQLYAARGLLLRPTGKMRGQYQRVGQVNVSVSDRYFRDEFHDEAISLDKKEVMTEDLYEHYDDELGLYTFTIV